MSETKCAWCELTVGPGIVLCGKCVQTLDTALTRVAGHYADLDTLRQKRTRYTTAATKGSIGKAAPLPLDLRFADSNGTGSQLAWDTKNTLVAWARTVLDGWPPLTGPACRDCLHVSCSEVRRRRHPLDTVGSVCAYIAGHRYAIAVCEWSTSLLDEVLDLERRLRRIVDRPIERQYVGQCTADPDDPNGPCGMDLYAEMDAVTVKCEACGTEHKVADRRDFLLATARGYAVTASEAAGALCSWTDYDGSPVKLVDLIRKWAEATKTRPPRLVSVGNIEHLGRDRALYRLGDIEVLLRGHVQQRSLRSSA